MSNNPTPPRIEREADERYKGSNAALIKAAGYKEGALAEINRAAPVVKALYVALGILELNQIEPEMAEEFRKVLQTYKADQ